MSSVATQSALDSLSIDQVLQRIRIDPDSGRGSVIDVIGLITGKDNNHAAECLRNLSATFGDVNEKIVNFQFPGRGQRPTPVAETPALIEIAWLCPGRAAKEFRRKGALTLCRALGGDLSLVDEIEQRHKEVTGTAEQRLLLNGTGVTEAMANRAQVGHKRSRVELEYEMWKDPRYSARQTMETVEMSKRLLTELGGLDAATEACLRDLSKNTLLQLTDGTSSGAVASPVTWGVVMRAQHLGYRVKKEDWSALGIAAIRAYRRHFGRDPACGKKPAFAGDSGCSVWHYTEEECRTVIDVKGEDSDDRQDKCM